MAFNTKIDSAGLTTLAGLGVLAFMDKKDKDKAKEKDKAGEALVKTAEPVVKPAEPTKPAEPVKTTTPQPQNTTGFRGKAAGELPSKPYPLNTLPNEKRKSQPYPVNQAKQTKAVMKNTADKFKKSDIARMDEGGNPYKSGGKVRSASQRADGCAIRGKTRA